MLKCVKWTSEMDEDLKSLMKKGLSATEVASFFNKKYQTNSGFTRNSVIGRASRIKLEWVKRKAPPKFSKETIQKNITKKIAATNKNTNNLISIELSQPVPIITHNAKTKFMDLKYGGCRYTPSEGDAGSFLFCNDPVVEGKSYCHEHHALCTYPYNRRV